MNIIEELANWLEDNNHGVLGESLYISVVPQDAPDDCYWIIAGGGTTNTNLITNNKLKSYIFNVYYRSMNNKKVYDTMYNLENLLNSTGCLTLPSYDIITAEVTVYPTDNDIDVEERIVGTVQLNLTIYT